MAYVSGGLGEESRSVTRKPMLVMAASRQLDRSQATGSYTCLESYSLLSPLSLRGLLTSLPPDKGANAWLSTFMQYLTILAMSNSQPRGQRTEQTETVSKVLGGPRPGMVFIG